jgi:hypothetical protein
MSRIGTRIGSEVDESSMSGVEERSLEGNERDNRIVAAHKYSSLTISDEPNLQSSPFQVFDNGIDTVQLGFPHVHSIFPSVEQICALQRRQLLLRKVSRRSECVR